MEGVQEKRFIRLSLNRLEFKDWVGLSDAAVRPYTTRGGREKGRERGKGRFLPKRTKR